MIKATLYEVMQANYDRWLKEPHYSSVYAVFGKDTLFEAIWMGGEYSDGSWEGTLVFKNTLFSPDEADVPGLQFKYPTPSAASGALCGARARHTWDTLVKVFNGLIDLPVDTKLRSGGL